MKVLSVTRLQYLRTCTISVLSLRDDPSKQPTFICAGLENPWLQNKSYVSCIPEGLYIIVKDTFKGLYDNYKVMNVRERSAIEIHAGNKVSDTSGCILVGPSLSPYFEKNKMYFSLTAPSRATLEKLVEVIGEQRAMLDIVSTGCSQTRLIGSELQYW